MIRKIINYDDYDEDVLYEDKEDYDDEDDELKSEMSNSCATGKGHCITILLFTAFEILIFTAFKILIFSATSHCL